MREHIQRNGKRESRKRRKKENGINSVNMYKEETEKKSTELPGERVASRGGC